MKQKLLSRCRTLPGTSPFLPSRAAPPSLTSLPQLHFLGQTLTHKWSSAICFWRT